MAKLTLSDPATLDNSILASIASNNAAIETAMENTLSRDGTSPNEMEADFDMNGFQILNLPEAVDPTDPVRLGELEDMLDGLTGALPTGGTTGQVLAKASATNGDVEWITASGLGTVTSVAATVPTGFSISGSPITSTGTLAITYTAGYQGYTAAEASKLSGIEALADVTDATNVTAAGALMDSELADITAIKTLLAPDNTTISTYGATLVDDADAGTARTTLGMSANGSSLVSAADYAAMKALLDLEIGTDVQAYDADLASWAGVTRAAGLDTFVATPSSANLASLVTDETGSGALVFATSPTLVTPALGTPSALVLTNATGLPLSSVVDSTSEALGVGSLELGHASDTTLSRSAAGVLAVEGAVLAFRDVTINAQTGTTYTLVLADGGKVITSSNASAQTITVPANASVAFPVGTVINILQIGAGATAIDGDTGVTVNGTSGGTVTIQTQYQGAALLKVATDTWIVSGDIA